MALTKNEICFQLFAIANAGADVLGAMRESKTDLDLEDFAEDVSLEIAKFRKGKGTKLTTDALETMLDKLAEFVGVAEAQRLVALRRTMDDVTRADRGSDHAKTFGREACVAWLKEREVKVTKKTALAKLNEAIDTAKVDTWEDEPEHEDNAKREAEAAESEKREAEKTATATATTATPAATVASPSKALTIQEPVAVQVTGKGKTYTGTLNLDATITFDTSDDNALVSGLTFPSASKAACAALAIPSTNGWLRVTFMKDGVRTPIDALRVNSKGYSLTGGGSRTPRVDLTGEGLDVEIARLKDRVSVLSRSLEKATVKLGEVETAKAKEDERDAADNAAEAGQFEAEVAAEEERDAAQDHADEEAASESMIAPPVTSKKSATTALEVADDKADRAQELSEMFMKDLRVLATRLKISGRSKLTHPALVDAVLAAEAEAANAAA